jgi:hypothetical protein
MKIGTILSAFALSVALITPAAVYAQPRPANAMFAPQPQDHDHREFTADDEKAWHDYLKERHKKDHEWAKANKREQADYWKWRDGHK